MLLSKIGEFGLIHRIKELTQQHSNKNIVVGIDDDAAAIRITDNDILLLTTDTMVEGIHFDLSYFTFEQLGQKIMAINISDIAAMGGRPLYALVALSIPPSVAVTSIEELYQGIIKMGKKYDVSIVGGDTTSTTHNIHISISLIGYTNTEKLTLRSGAQEGDVICITGYLGMSKAGLRVLKNKHLFNQNKFEKLIFKHLTPEPRIQESQFIIQNANIHSMIDISDGLLSDLDHICILSGVGAELYSKKIPLHKLAKEVACTLDESLLDYSFNGGEDFELLLILSEIDYEKIKHNFKDRFGINLNNIGFITKKEQGFKVMDDVGNIVPINNSGYNHFA